MTSTKTLLSGIFIMLAFTTWSQQQKKAWSTKDMFEQRCFIENLGQYNVTDFDKNVQVLYGSYTRDNFIFFTNRGILFKHMVKVERTKRELKAIERELEANGKVEKEEEEGEDEKIKYKFKNVYQEVLFENANENPKTLVEGEVITKYHFPKPGTNQTLIAKGYSKLTYKNIYPNIDVEFYFPKDSSGFKYNYIVHPGGNPNLIKERWTDKANIQLAGTGDIFAQTKYGKFKLNKPVTYSGDQILKSNYQLNNSTVSYQIEGDVKNGCIIDPWTVTPAFPGGTSGFDIDFDVNGNTYVYGGNATFHLLKYDATGTLDWSYSTSLFTGGYYGDFAVDFDNGTSYLVAGYTVSGPNVLKVNTAGVMVASHAGSSLMNEAWRIAFSSCTDQAVIGAGGTSASNQISYLDTNLTTLTPVNVLGATTGYNDIALLALDNYGSCYLLSAYGMTTPHTNNIVKSPMPSFLPITWSVPSGYYYQEIYSNQYSMGNGHNGLTVGNKTLFSSDNYMVYKRSTATGAVLGSKRINLPPGGDSTNKYFSGIHSDDCLNLFVADHDTVRQYDSLLNELNYYVMPGTICDLKFDRAGLLHVAGDNFINVFTPTGITACSGAITPNLSVIDASCATNGSASVSPTGGEPPYTITWSTSPVSTGTSVSDLPPGNYTVTIRDSSCTGNIGIINFTVGWSGFDVDITSANVSCNGLTDGSISVLPVGGFAPYVYAWDTLSLTGSSVTGLGAGVYGLSVTDSTGCEFNANVVITEPSAIVGSTDADSVNCFGGTANLLASATGGNSPYNFTWNTSPVVTGATYTGASPGVYSITIEDDMGCTHTFTDTLYEPAELNVSVVTTDVHCSGTPLGSMVATATGGTGSYDYLWSNDASNNTNTNSGLVAGVYTLTITDDKGCTTTLTDTVYDVDFPTISLSDIQPCNSGTNGSISATAVGGTTGITFNYSWNTTPVQTGLNATGIPAGPYTLTVEALGCTQTFPFILGEAPIVDTLSITGIVCGVRDFATLDLPGIALPTYTWFNDGVTVIGANGNQLNVVLPNIPLTTATWFYNGCKYLTTTINTEYYPVVSPNMIPNIFTPNGDGQNDTYRGFTFVETTPAEQVVELFQDYSIKVYNRWGQLEFETNDPNFTWNGNGANGSPVSDGVYFTIVTYTSLCGESSDQVIYNGSIQVIR